MFNTAVLFLLCLFNSAPGYEPPSPLTLELILEISKWRSWKQIVIFDDLSPRNRKHKNLN